MVGFLTPMPNTKMVFGRSKILVARLEYVYAIRTYFGAFAAPYALIAAVNDVFADFIAETRWRRFDPPGHFCLRHERF